MSEIIREIEENDFYQVSKLYNFRKSIDELKWLYTNIDDAKSFNAFVAINADNEIVGVIGYALSEYCQGDKYFTGVIPMTWKLCDDYKGLSGVLLFKKILKLGSVGIAIGGSDTAKDLYPLFKFKQISTIDIFYKILNYPETYKSFSSKKYFLRIGLISYLFFKNIRNFFNDVNYDDIHLEPYTGSDYKEVESQTLSKKVTKKHIDWLLRCPKLESFAFHISHNEEYFGICIVYVQDFKNYKKGRIVHLPHLGNKPIVWKKVISKITDFLYTKNCCLITGLGHNVMNRSGFINSGFVTIKGHSKPLYIKDHKQITETFAIHEWLLQYSESDKAYRDM